MGTLRAEYSTAQTQAQQATATANSKAKAAYAARNAALDARSKSLGQRARAIRAADGELQSSRISSDNECYYATLNSTSTSDISDNNNFDGPETVDVSGAYAFRSMAYAHGFGSADLRGALL